MINNSKIDLLTPDQFMASHNAVVQQSSNRFSNEGLVDELATVLVDSVFTAIAREDRKQPILPEIVGRVKEELRSSKLSEPLFEQLKLRAYSSLVEWLLIPSAPLDLDPVKDMVHSVFSSREKGGSRGTSTSEKTFIRFIDSTTETLNSRGLSKSFKEVVMLVLRERYALQGNGKEWLRTIVLRNVLNRT